MAIGITFLLGAVTGFIIGILVPRTHRVGLIGIVIGATALTIGGLLAVQHYLGEEEEEEQQQQQQEAAADGSAAAR